MSETLATKHIRFGSESLKEYWYQSLKMNIDPILPEHISGKLIRCSWVPSCLRKCYVCVKNKIPPDILSLGNMGSGTGVHEFVQSRMHKAGFLKQIELELERKISFDETTFTLRGHIDGIFDDDTILDIKSSKNLDYYGSREHIDQITLYMLLKYDLPISKDPIKENISAIIWYISKLNLANMIIVDVEYDPLIAFTNIRRAAFVANCLQNDKLPPAEPGWICGEGYHWVCPVMSMEKIDCNGYD